MVYPHSHILADIILVAHLVREVAASTKSSVTIVYPSASVVSTPSFSWTSILSDLRWDLEHREQYKSFNDYSQNIAIDMIQVIDHQDFGLGQFEFENGII